MKEQHRILWIAALAVGVATLGVPTRGYGQAAYKKPNVVMLMHDDTGWFDFGCYGGGRVHSATRPRTLIAWPRKARGSRAGTARPVARRAAASFMTGRIPIRSALSVVVVPGDRERFRKRKRRPSPSSTRRTVTTTYFSGKWHLGDVPEFYPIEHGFDEMKEFGAYYPRRLHLQRHQSPGSTRGFLRTIRSSRRCTSAS